MTLGEAVVKAGNYRRQVIGRRKSIDGTCYRASDIRALPIEPEGDDFEVFVDLTSVSIPKKTSLVQLEYFLDAGLC